MKKNKVIFIAFMVWLMAMPAFGASVTGGGNVDGTAIAPTTVTTTGNITSSAGTVSGVTVSGTTIFANASSFSGSYPSIAARYPNESSYVVSLFDSGATTTWQYISGTGYLADDTTNYVLGSKSIKWITTEASKIVRGDWVTNFNLSEYSAFRVKCYIDIPANLTQINFYFGNTALTAYYHFGLVHAGGSIGFLQQGWNDIVFNLYKADVTGSPSWSTIQNIRITANSSASGPISINFNEMTFLKNNIRGGIVIFSFDDGYQNIYYNAKPIFDKYNYAATEFVIGSLSGVTPYMFPAHLHILQDAGWDIGSHTWTHANMLTNTNAQNEIEMQTMQAWLRGNGFRAWDIFAYPYGYYNDSVKSIVQKYARCARKVQSYFSPVQPYPLAFNPYEIPAMALDSSMSISGATGYVNNLVTYGGVLLFYGHNISGTSGVSTWSSTDLDTLLAWIKSKNSLRVMTFSEYLNSLVTDTGAPQYVTVPVIASGTTTPATTPTKVGDIFVDKVLHKVFISDCTTSSSCWNLLN
jgi:peptidoglycan/xylan/chitin deacetylase (PgdA/CDA1 family)